MVPGHGSCEKDFSNFLHTKYRPVCYPRKQTVSGILLPATDRGSMVYRCFKCKLERNVCICISPSNSTSPSFAESTTGTVHTNSSCTSEPNSIVVSGSSRAGYRLSKTPTKNTETSDAGERSLDTSRPIFVETCCVENISDRRDQNLSESSEIYH